MPPAFNLSQDQTLQFNLLLLQSRIPSQLLLRSQNTDKVLLSKSLLSLVNVRLPTPQTSTLIICLFLKIVSPISYPPANNKALCLSSTEKRNYFTSLTSCQELFSTLFLFSFLTFCAVNFLHRAEKWDYGTSLYSCQLFLFCCYFFASLEGCDFFNMGHPVFFLFRFSGRLSGATVWRMENRSLHIPIDQTLTSNGKLIKCLPDGRSGDWPFLLSKRF